VDVLFNQREKKEGNVSFDVFINALDGVVSKEDCMIFMTTNHIDNIDEALMRPGRVDTQLEFKEGQFTHFKAMAEYLYDIKLTVGQENRLAQLLGLHKTYKHALIQNFFIKYDTFDEMVKEKEVFEKFRERYN
jgi:chaperone BCS1